MQPRSFVADLPPASFAFVMATGIVAVAARQQGFVRLPLLFFGLAAAGWSLLVALCVLRLAWFHGRVLQDLRDHLRAPGFFTIVAATSVLAACMLVLDLGVPFAVLLGALAFLLWLVLTYGVLAALVTKEHKPPLDRGLGGGWLLAVVACQSIAVVCALLSPHAGQPLRLHLNFVALCNWVFAGTLYTWLIALIFYRYLFFRFAPADLTPPYWINMGAMAISTLAGSQLVANAAQAPLLQSLLPFLKGFTILYWATGTWWMPLLVVLTAWRYGVRRDPVRADAVDWSMVFPLGMYAAATHHMDLNVTGGILAPADRVFFWIALAVWSVTALARVVAWRRIRRDQARA